MQSSTNSTVNRSTHDSSRSKSNTPALRVIPLGGLHEIGKNTCVFEYGDELMLVDAGLAFPSDGMHGVNVVMPDTTFLKENQRRIKGMIVTHGHEDHIGGISHHLSILIFPLFMAQDWQCQCLEEKWRKQGYLIEQLYRQ